MGILNIVECDRLIDPDNRAQIARPLTTGTNLTTSTSTAKTSSDFSANVKFIRIVADTAMYVKLGNSSVEAAVGDRYLPAGIPDYLPIADGQTRIAAIEPS